MNICASTVIDKIPVITFSEFHGMIGKFCDLIFVEENSFTIHAVLMYMLVQIICITKWHNRSIHLSGGWIPGRKKPGRTAGIHGYPAGCHKCQRWPHWWENSRESTSRRGETSGKPGTVVMVDHLILSYFKFRHVIENAWNMEAFTCYCIFIYQARGLSVIQFDSSHQVFTYVKL